MRPTCTITLHAPHTAHRSALWSMPGSSARFDHQAAWHRFQDVLHADLDPANTSAISEGLHLAAAGTLDLVQRCYAGIQIGDDVLWLAPCLPPELEELQLPVRYRGHWLDLRLTQRALEVSVRE